MVISQKTYVLSTVLGVEYTMDKITSRQDADFGMVYDCPKCEMVFTVSDEAERHLDLDHTH